MPGHAGALRLVACLSFSLAAACKPGPPIDRGPDTGRAPRPAEVAMQGEPASRYRADDGDLSQSPLARRLGRSFPTVAVSACLERTASTLARARTAQSGQFPQSLVEQALHWAGCPDATARVTTLSTDADDESGLLGAIAALVAQEPPTHFGAARAPADAPYRWRWVLCSVTRRYSLLPLASWGSPGSSVPIQFRVDQRFRDARVMVTTPNGEVHQVVTGSSQGWVVAGVELSPDVGQQWVELVAESTRGPEVLALFPIEVGGRPRATWDPDAHPDEGAAQTIGQVEDALVRLIARERERRGLLALGLDPRLCDVARRYSQEMARSGNVKHVSPTSGAVTDRLREAGFPSRFAAENLARSATIGEAHEGLMRSPAHRAAILSTEPTQLGVGVDARDEEGGTVYFVTELFVRPLQPTDAGELARGILDEIALRRLANGLPPLAEGDALGGVATRLAAAFARGQLADHDLEAVVPAELTRQGQAWSAWRTFHGQAFEFGDVTLPDEVSDPAMDRVGVGVAQSSQSEQPASFLVLLVGGPG